MNTKNKLNIVAPVAIALVATSALTGCSSSRKEIEATSTKLEYGKEPVQSLTLIKGDTDGITASPETVDVTKVGETKVTYTSGKSSTDIIYEIEDTKLPVLTINNEDLSYKTKAKAESKITSSDEVDGELKKLEKAPEALETDSTKIGKAEFYDEGWYTVDLSKVDTAKTGEYDAIATTADKHGNMVTVSYKVTVSDDGKKSNSTATIQIKTADEDMTLSNVSVDKTSAIISDFNENTAESFKESYKEELTSSTESSATNSDKDKSTVTTEDKKSDSKKEDTSNNASETKKDTVSNSNNSTATNSSAGNNKPASKPSANTSSGSNSSSNNSSSSKPSHTHNWVAQYTTVHHDAQYNTVHHDATGHYETQTVSEGYYSEEPVYETGYVNQCSGCGLTQMDFGNDYDKFMTHIENEGSRYKMVWKTLQVGTQQVWHDPVTQQVWVEDSPAYDEQVKVSDAYDEQVVSGYKCSSCGATK